MREKQEKSDECQEEREGGGNKDTDVKQRQSLVGWLALTPEMI